MSASVLRDRKPRETYFISWEEEVRTRKTRGTKIQTLIRKKSRVSIELERKHRGGGVLFVHRITARWLFKKGKERRKTAVAGQSPAKPEEGSHQNPYRERLSWASCRGRSCYELGLEVFEKKNGERPQIEGMRWVYRGVPVGLFMRFFEGEEGERKETNFLLFLSGLFLCCESWRLFLIGGCQSVPSIDHPSSTFYLKIQILKKECINFHL